MKIEYGVFNPICDLDAEILDVLQNLKIYSKYLFNLCSLMIHESVGEMSGISQTSVMLLFPLQQKSIL